MFGEEKLSIYLNRSKLLSNVDCENKIRVAILGSFTLNGLEETIRVKCSDKKIQCSTYIAGYNQYNQEILDEKSELYKFSSDITFLIIDTRNVLGELFFNPYSISVEDRKQFRQLMKMAELTKPSYNIIVQEFIQDSFGKDLRVLVVNGKVVGCMMRKSIDGDFRANITRGGEAIPYQIDENIEWLGGECARLLNLDIAGVDLLFNNGSYTICEVNSAPGFEGMEKYTNKNIAVEMVNYVVKKIGG